MSHLFLLRVLFSVAITRAQALLIIIGDPTVLSLDPLWRSFMNYVYQSGGWKGQLPTWDTSEKVNTKGGYDKGIKQTALDDMNEFTRAMEALTLAGAQGGGVEEEDDIDHNADRPWVELE
jgi:helicase MOV-10